MLRILKTAKIPAFTIIAFLLVVYVSYNIAFNSSEILENAESVGVSIFSNYRFFPQSVLILKLILVITNMLVISIFVINQRIILPISILTAFFYIVLILILGVDNQPIWILIIHNLISFSLFFLNIYLSNNKIIGALAWSGIFVSLSTMIYFPSILMIPAYFVMINNSRQIHLKHSVLVLLSFIFPYIFYHLIFFILNKTYFVDYASLFHFKLMDFDLSFSFIIKSIIILLPLALVSIIKFASRIQLNWETKQNILNFTVLFVFSLISFLFTNTNTEWALNFLLVSSAILYSISFNIGFNKLISKILLLLLLVLSLITQIIN